MIHGAFAENTSWALRLFSGQTKLSVCSADWALHSHAIEMERKGDFLSVYFYIKVIREGYVQAAAYPRGEAEININTGTPTQQSLPCQARFSSPGFL